MSSSACFAQPSTEELERAGELRAELELLRTEILETEKKNEKYVGGLVKGLIEARLEVLKTTEVLIQQRVHALESGAKVDVVVSGTEPDAALAQRLESEISGMQEGLAEARAEADRYSGGLVASMKAATVATSEQTLAMLRQRFLAAKYGLAIPQLESLGSQAGDEAAPGPVTQDQEASIGAEMIGVRLLRKNFTKQDYQDFVFFDIEFTAQGLEKPARAIKGVLHLQDLFGETRMNIKWTLEEPLAPGGSIVEKGQGFKYNQFMDDHQWVRSTDLEDMTGSMTVLSVLFADGTRLDL